LRKNKICVLAASVLERACSNLSFLYD